MGIGARFSLESDAAGGHVGGLSFRAVCEQFSGACEVFRRVNS